MEFKLQDKELEREINNVIQDIKIVSENLGDGLYEKMITEIYKGNDKNEIEKMDIINKYHKILLPQIHKENGKLEANINK